MNTRYSQTATVAVAVVALLSLAVAATGGVAAQEEAAQGYEIDVETPDGLAADDDQRIGVEVDNTEGDSDLFSPIVEIPFPDDFDVSDEALDNAYIEYENGTTESVEDAEVLDSSFRSGDAIYLYGETVVQGEVETYYVNVSIDDPGSSTLETETRLLYNEDADNVTARTSEEVDVSGFGNISATVSQLDGTERDNVPISIDGSSVGDGLVDVERVEGTYEISADPEDTPVSMPTFTETVGVGDDVSVEYTVPDDFDSVEEPLVIGTNGSASVAEGSLGESTVQEPTAKEEKQFEVSYLLRTSSGTDVVFVPDPDDIGPVEERNGSIDSDSGEISLTAEDDGTTAQITADSDTTAAVTYEGYRLGDTDKNGKVEDNDAVSVAQTVAEMDTESGDEYYDVDGDGEITSTDAMYIAQYSADNREDYGGDS